jgi:hypothetical protein
MENYPTNPGGKMPRKATKKKPIIVKKPKKKKATKKEKEEEERLLATLPDVVLPGKKTATSYEPPADLDYDEWRVYLFQLVTVDQFCKWAVGAMLNYGESHYGEKYAQAADETGYPPEYLSIIKYVENRVKPLTRVRELHWSHHRLVAKLKEEDQQDWLERARMHGWSVHDMEEQMRAAKERVEAYQEPELKLEAELTEEKDEPPPCLELLKWAVNHIYEPKHDNEEARVEWETQFQAVRKLTE